MSQNQRASAGISSTFDSVHDAPTPMLQQLLQEYLHTVLKVKRESHGWYLFDPV